MKEVQNKWNTLKMNDDIWAKLIYFEQNRRLAKAYVSAPVLTVDGSTCGLDGFRIGLSGIDNDYRNLESIASLRSIGQGIKLKIDSQGNILIRKISPRLSASSTGANQSSSSSSQHLGSLGSRCSVYVKDWPSTRSSSSNERAKRGVRDEQENTCTIHELGDSDASYKLFDMHKFRMQLEKRKLMGDTSMDWRQCVSIISFVRNPSSTSNSSGHSTSSASNSSLDNQKYNSNQKQAHLLKDPCWLMLINIIAIDMLKSSICDNLPSSRSQPQEQQRSSSTLLRDHRILSTSQQPNLVATGSRPQISSEQRKVSTTHSIAPPVIKSVNQHAPLRTSSSASVLYNPNMNSNSNQPIERVKKLRINVTPNSSGMQNNISSGRQVEVMENENEDDNYLEFVSSSGASSSSPYYRSYQSSQQLPTSASQAAGNNVIYTTFNSKFINPRGRQQISSNNNNLNLASAQNELATSDYNSASRSSRSQQDYGRGIYASSGSNYQDTPTITSTTNGVHLQTRRSALGPSNYNRKLAPHSRLMNSSTLSRTGDRNPTATPNGSNSSKPIGGSGYKLSSSSIELAAERKIPVHSSQIKMHYDSFHLDVNRLSKGNLLPNLTNTINRSDKLTAARDSFDVLKRSSLLRSNNHNQRKSTIDHNECSAIQGSTELMMNDSEGQKNRIINQSDMQKISRSSTASSSSSGCIDNDYFMSQSSSSMSSSTTQSNECSEEMFSQPASSSGIVCSGNTSDECGETATTPSETTKLNSPVEAPPPSSKDPHRSLESAKGSSKSNSAKTSGLKSPTSTSMTNPRKISSSSSNLRISSPSLPSTTAAMSNRGFKIKSIPDEYCAYCHQSAQPTTCLHNDELGGASVVDCLDCAQCDCLLTVGQHQHQNEQVIPLSRHRDDDAMADCDCYCDCAMGAGHASVVATPKGYSKMSSKLWKLPRAYGSQTEIAASEEPIYDLLPSPRRSNSRMASPMRSATIDRSHATSGNSGSLTRSNRRNSRGSSNHLASVTSLAHIGEIDLDRISPAPLTSNGMGLEGKQQRGWGNKENSTSWLERRKYINILLPKFMFGSKNSKQQVSPTNQASDQTDLFRDRGYRKFSSTRLSRSTHKLS